MNEMLPEERQIVETLNPWLKLSLCDRDWHRSLYIKSFGEETTENQQKERRKIEEKKKRRTRLRTGNKKTACHANGAFRVILCLLFLHVHTDDIVFFVTFTTQLVPHPLPLGGVLNMHTSHDLQSSLNNVLKYFTYIAQLKTNTAANENHR